VLALLQFDAVSVPLVERLLDEGRMPALAALRAAGRWRRLEAPQRLVSSAVWPSVYTGTEPGEHGLYYVLQWSAAEQRIRTLDSMANAETTWERLSRERARSLVIDPLLSWRPQRMEGTFLSGWQLNHDFVLRHLSYPRTTYLELARKFGRTPAFGQVFGRPSPARLLTIRDQLVSAPQRAAALVDHLLPREKFDLLWVTFAGAHLAGHWLWDPVALFDGSLDRDTRDRLTDALADVYVAVDEAIGRILAALPPGADVIVFSPEGMGPNTSRSDLLPDMLTAVLHGRSSSGRRRAGPGSRLWRFRGAIPVRHRKAVSQVIPGRMTRELSAYFYLRGVDWSGTRAFAVPGATDGLVRLNIRGREREGIVEPADAEALMEEIATGLESFTDPDGAPAVARVERVAGTFSGPRADGLPDLVVRWSERPSRELTFVSSERHGKVARRGAGAGWLGNHMDDAWILLPPADVRLREPQRPPRLVDIAATACHLTGGDTSGLAGEPLLEPC
jgi:predicted AlkP superfamily phosphohydrolase/phosphomutase